MSRTVVAVAGMLLILTCARARAQSGDGPMAPLPRAFVGGGVGPSTRDEHSRMRLADLASPFIWFVEGGGAVTRRVGAGAEFARPSPIVGETAGQSFRSWGRQEERILVGLLRVRALGEGRLAVDVVGGAGVMFQHHELRFAPCFAGCADSYRAALDRRAPAFVFGAEAPVRVGRHLWVGGLFRLYALHRGEPSRPTGSIVPWQFEYRSSTRWVLGVSGRAGW